MASHLRSFRDIISLAWVKEDLLQWCKQKKFLWPSCRYKPWGFMKCDLIYTTREIYINFSQKINFRLRFCFWFFAFCLFFAWQETRVIDSYDSPKIFRGSSKDISFFGDLFSFVAFGSIFFWRRLSSFEVAFRSILCCIYQIIFRLLRKSILNFFNKWMH